MNEFFYGTHEVTVNQTRCSFAFPRAIKAVIYGKSPLHIRHQDVPTPPLKIIHPFALTETIRDELQDVLKETNSVVSTDLPKLADTILLAAQTNIYGDRMTPYVTEINNKSGLVIPEAFREKTLPKIVTITGHGKFFSVVPKR